MPMQGENPPPRMNESHKRFLQPPTLQQSVRSYPLTTPSAYPKSPQADLLSNRSGGVSSPRVRWKAATNKPPVSRGLNAGMNTSRRAAYHLMRERLKLCGGRVGKGMATTRNRKVVTSFGTAPRFEYSRSNFGRTLRRSSSSLVENERRHEGSYMYQTMERQSRTPPNSSVERTVSRSSWSDNSSSHSLAEIAFTATKHEESEISRSSPICAARAKEAQLNRMSTLRTTALHGQQAIAGTQRQFTYGDEVALTKTPYKQKERVNSADSTEDLRPNALPRLSTKEFSRRAHTAEQGATPATTCSTPFKALHMSTPPSPQTPLSFQISGRREKVEALASCASRVSRGHRGIERNVRLQMSQPLSTLKHGGRVWQQFSPGPLSCEWSCPLAPCCRSPTISDSISIKNPRAVGDPLLSAQKPRFIPRYRPISPHLPHMFERQRLCPAPCPMYRADRVTVKTHRVIHQAF